MIQAIRIEFPNLSNAIRQKIHLGEILSEMLMTEWSLPDWNAPIYPRPPAFPPPAPVSRSQPLPLPSPPPATSNHPRPDRLGIGYNSSEISGAGSEDNDIRSDAEAALPLAPAKPPGVGWKQFLDSGCPWWYYNGELGQWWYSTHTEVLAPYTQADHEDAAEAAVATELAGDDDAIALPPPRFLPHPLPANVEQQSDESGESDDDQMLPAAIELIQKGNIVDGMLVLHPSAAHLRCIRKPATPFNAPHQDLLHRLHAIAWGRKMLCEIKMLEDVHIWSPNHDLGTHAFLHVQFQDWKQKCGELLDKQWERSWHGALSPYILNILATNGFYPAEKIRSVGTGLFHSNNHGQFYPFKYAYPSPLRMRSYAAGIATMHLEDIDADVPLYHSLVQLRVKAPLQWAKTKPPKKWHVTNNKDIKTCIQLEAALFCIYSGPRSKEYAHDEMGHLLERNGVSY